MMFVSLVFSRSMSKDKRRVLLFPQLFLKVRRVQLDIAVISTSGRVDAVCTERPYLDNFITQPASKS
jgi:hypothetical protein